MLMLLVEAAQRGKLDRDVIFLAESGEEGFAEAGMKHVIAKHWEEIDCEFALAEGGGGYLKDGQPHIVHMATTEKVGRGVRLVARGTSGHGSVPRPDNAVVRLAAAVAKLGVWQSPSRLNDTTATYFERLAAVSPAGRGGTLPRAFRSRRPARRSSRYFSEHDLLHNSMLRTSIAPTIIQGGFRQNVIPSEAEARWTSARCPTRTTRRSWKRCARSSTIRTSRSCGAAAQRPAAPASRLNTEMFRALETVQKRLYPQAITVPYPVDRSHRHGAAAVGRRAVPTASGRWWTAASWRPAAEPTATTSASWKSTLHDFVRFQWHDGAGNRGVEVEPRGDRKRWKKKRSFVTERTEGTERERIARAKTLAGPWDS